jgi:hypothetical protein
MTEAVGDAFQDINVRLAILIYRELGIMDKVS